MSERVVPAGAGKVELHLHLDGCLSFGAVRALRPSTSLAEFRRDYVAPVKCADLVDFLSRTTRLVALLQSEAALRLMCEDLFAQLAADHVVYAELRFAPLLHTAGGLAPEAVVRVVEEAVLASIAATGVQARIILCALRHYDSDESLLTAQLARAAVERGLVAGLDLAGDEAGFGLDAHVAAFAIAREHGVQLTAHAGEARGADSVSETLDRLAPERIGHGVRSIEDPAVVERLATSGVHLEVCPTSNLQTMGARVPSYGEHPVDALRRAGVPVSISTDTRTTCAVTLDREYERLQVAFGWTATELVACNHAALAASFAPPTLKAELQPRLAPSAR